MERELTKEEIWEKVEEYLSKKDLNAVMYGIQIPPEDLVYDDTDSLVIEKG